MKEINFNYYEENASEFFESTVTADMVDLYTSFLSMVSPGGRILDLGCGSGRDSKYFIRQGFQVEAMDGLLGRKYSAPRSKKWIISRSSMESGLALL